MSSKAKARRGGNTCAPKAKKGDDQHILLARGMSARFIGANIPLSGLASEEIDRDLRHMEAYNNACTVYAQQYYIYQNNSNNPDGEISQDSSHHRQQMPLVAMPVRIDPEEEKRLMNLRLKIQQCEAQREVLESQYLSLRAHYVYTSQVLKKYRGTVNRRIAFLQDAVRKRGKLLALQRVRLQVARDALHCLRQRESRARKDGMMDDGEDLVDVWNAIDDKFRKAEQECRSDGVEPWSAVKIPKIPPGVPVYLSQLCKAPGQGAAYGVGSIFGSSKESMVWIESNLPVEPPKTGASLPALREEAAMLRKELDKERSMNRDLHTNIISRRNRNDELVAMMTLLRTETEAVVARHNVLLGSDQAQEAAFSLHEEDLEFKKEEETLTPRDGQIDDLAKPTVVAEDTPNHLEQEPAVEEVSAPAEPVEEKTPESLGEGSSDPSRIKVDDEENDGDDEGEEDEEDEGEILEDEEGEDRASKRSYDANGENGSPRSGKRRKV